jgi:hypothetical protein
MESSKMNENFDLENYDNLSTSAIYVEQEIFYIIYQTTNLLKKENEENRFYVGMHKQYDTSGFDDYYGSSNILTTSRKKYGDENFRIL